jgi:hypothetical protein
MDLTAGASAVDPGFKAACDCGVAYILAGDYAARALARPEFAGKSDRAIGQKG